MRDMDTQTRIERAAKELFAYCHANDWAGHDPYDALNSSLLARFPAIDSKLTRLVLTQTLKRSPVSVRGLLGIPKTQNPKGLALFLSALLKSPGLAGARQKELVDSLAATILALRSTGEEYWCWGYSFPWQTRTIIVPRGTPNLVCTTFVAGALLDLYEQHGEARYLEIAASAADYIRTTLYWSENATEAGFSYPLPSIRNHIHNANLLAAALLIRVHKHTGAPGLLEPALKVARYSAACQAEDGSWPYGDRAKQQWIDNFHTGYNLSALDNIGRDLNTDEFAGRVQKGYEFYRTHFIREDGAARYFHNETYPIDIHCVSQSILTLVEFRDKDPGNLAAAGQVAQWALDNMWDKRGYFYYRVLRSCKVRTSYMRWSQAWMLLALSELLAATADRAETQPRVPVDA